MKKRRQGRGSWDSRAGPPKRPRLTPLGAGQSSAPAPAHCRYRPGPRVPWAENGAVDDPPTGSICRGEPRSSNPQPTHRWMAPGGVFGSRHGPAPGRVGPGPLGITGASCNHTPRFPGRARTVHASVDGPGIHHRHREEAPDEITTLPTLVCGGRLSDTVANIATDPHGVNLIGHQGHPFRSDASAVATPPKRDAHRQKTPEARCRVHWEVSKT